MSVSFRMFKRLLSTHAVRINAKGGHSWVPGFFGVQPGDLLQRLAEKKLDSDALRRAEKIGDKEERRSEETEGRVGQGDEEGEDGRRGERSAQPIWLPWFSQELPGEGIRTNRRAEWNGEHPAVT
ncbi:unnamed protein product [Larinioides sclopetarius]|uniref:Uncharacterized protein n=1 Tax=Larinioides sclopetarius TaxID=280406 RepID=A0AAV1ZNZ2_9ARAC